MIDLSSVHEGMEVYGSDGHKIGTVGAVQATAIGGSGLDTDNVTDLDAGSTPNTYIKVVRHHRLGHDPAPLYVPSTQIASVEPVKRVTLECTAEACEERYRIEPPGLS